MKFLCDNCKSKYQIADDKVSGRTVRMKCRKCGHLIEIRAVAAEGGSVSAAPVEPTNAPAPAPSAARVPAAAAKAPAAAPRPAARPAASGLASAFNRAVSEPATAAALEPAPDAGETDAAQWFAGVNGVPIGPMRMAELRAKVASNLVNEDTLVWREGMDEWSPLRVVSELSDVLKARRPSAPTAAAKTTSQSSAKIIPLHKTADKPAPPEEEDSATLFVPGGGAQLRDQLLGGLKKEPEAPATPGVEKDPFGDFAAPAAAAGAAGVVSDPFASPATTPAPPVAQPQSAPVSGAASSYAVEPPAPIIIQRGIPVAGWIAISLALVAGLAAGALIFKGDPQKTTVQFVTVSAPLPGVPGADPANPGANAANQDPGSTVPGPDGKPIAKGPANAASPGGKGPAGKDPKDPKDPKDSKDNKDMGSLDLGGIANTAAAPGPGGGGAEKSGGVEKSNLPSAVDAGEIARAINNAKSSMRKACLDGYASSLKPGSSVSVTISLLIGADGSVQSATGSGGSGVPGLANCVAARAKGWRFSPAQGPTQTSPTITWVMQ